MRGLLLISGVLSLALAQHPLTAHDNYNEVEAAAASFINRAENELHGLAQDHTLVEWAYESNITDHNEKVKLAFKKKADAISLRLGKEAKKYQSNEIRDRGLKRKLRMLATIGPSALPQDKLDRYNDITNKMAKIYSTAKFPAYKDKSRLVRLEPDLTEILASSRDPEELEYYWTRWREETGEKMRDLYIDFVKLSNEAAKLNGFRDATEMRTEDYESDTFVQEMEETWFGLKELYEHLHAYVRNKLVKM